MPMPMQQHMSCKVQLLSTSFFWNQAYDSLVDQSLRVTASCLSSAYVVAERIRAYGDQLAFRSEPFLQARHDH